MVIDIRRESGFLSNSLPRTIDEALCLAFTLGVLTAHFVAKLVLMTVYLKYV